MYEVYTALVEKRKGDGWLSWQRTCLLRQYMGSNPDISQKYKMGDISKGLANTLYPAKNIQNRTTAVTKQFPHRLL